DLEHDVLLAGSSCNDADLFIQTVLGLDEQRRDDRYDECHRNRHSCKVPRNDARADEQQYKDQQRQQGERIPFGLFRFHDNAPLLNDFQDDKKAPSDMEEATKKLYLISSLQPFRLLELALAQTSCCRGFKGPVPPPLLIRSRFI